MLILGVESSCDDTAAAVLDDRLHVYSSVLSSQDDIHSLYGGIVPELASRRHIENILPIVEKALKDANITLDQIDLVAATQGPGLIGSLLVGYTFAKSLSFFLGKKFIGVDHMAGHVLASFLEEDTPDFPFIALIVSGGTSSIVLAKGYTDFELLGRTRDDAAGEAFDKVAKLLDLPYPGGPNVAACADRGTNSEKIVFPRAWLEEGSFDFSFSGLKTAVLTWCMKNRSAGRVPPVDSICAAFQDAVVDVLVTKTINAARKYGISSIVLGGGVSANRCLRQVFAKRCQGARLKLFLPQPKFCTDNAAMIAAAGYFSFVYGKKPASEEDVYSRSQLG